MRKVMLLILALLTVAGAIGTSPATEAVGGGGTPGCNWTCDCAGSLVCVCRPGVTGSCPYPPDMACTQGYNCLS